MITCYKALVQIYKIKVNITNVTVLPLTQLSWRAILSMAIPTAIGYKIL